MWQDPKLQVIKHLTQRRPGSAGPNQTKPPARASAAAWRAGLPCCRTSPTVSVGRWNTRWNRRCLDCLYLCPYIQHYPTQYLGCSIDRSRPLLGGGNTHTLFFQPGNKRPHLYNREESHDNPHRVSQNSILGQSQTTSPPARYRQTRRFSTVATTPAQYKLMIRVAQRK